MAAYSGLPGYALLRNGCALLFRFVYSKLYFSEYRTAAAVITGDTDRPYIEYCKKQRKSSYDYCILKYELGIMPRQLEHRGGQ